MKEDMEGSILSTKVILWANENLVVCIELLSRLLHEFLDYVVVVFLDDILIYSMSKEEHEKHLSLVLEALQKNLFYAKLKKCVFFTIRSGVSGACY
jgi:hypothetical protein